MPEHGSVGPSPLPKDTCIGHIWLLHHFTTHYATHKLTPPPYSHIVFHEQNAAQLAICDGISGASDSRCCSNSAETSGVRGSANFTLAALRPGAKITLTKTRWEECVHAARDKCPTGSLRGVCRQGASLGDVEFWLKSTMYAVEL